MDDAAEGAAGRVFLFLQGPHGPFFRRLALWMVGAGARVRRVAFNRADEAEWSRAGPLDRSRGPVGAYAEWLAHYLVRYQVTDIVLYGDTRPEHALAIAVARSNGVLCHCLEEGYLRPHCITYERWGNNANSPLLDIPLERIARALGRIGPPAEAPGDGWRAHYAHLWHSLRYHARLLLPSRHFGRYRSRRGISLGREFANYLGRLAGLPPRRIAQGRRARRLLADGRPYHLVLLQLSFDCSMRVHSDYAGSAEFAADCIVAFARGAPPGELLVFKSHPFDDGRERLGRVIAAAAAHAGVADRVLFLDGGARLAALLDGAATAVTVNSTAAQQALWRGLPVIALGRAVYSKPGLVSDQSLAAFFAAPRPPDREAYWQFRQFLTETSQLRGSFYSRRGIAALLEVLPQVVLSPADPYQRRLAAASSRSRIAASNPAPAAPAHRAPAALPGDVPPPEPVAV